MKRHRILRKHPAIRSMISETTLRAQDFIVPVFVTEGSDRVVEIPSMPGYFKRSIDKTLEHVRSLRDEGLRALLLFVQVPESRKDNTGREALKPDGLMQRSIAEVKSRMPDMVVFTDIALDPYSSYGHDGIVQEGEIVNDPTVEVLARIAVSHARAGADFVAPSDMMDGRVGAIRSALDSEGFTGTGILAYSAKYASAFYGPFRNALDSAPGFGDKKTYQMDPANAREAVREVMSDIDEGADIVMVKPAMPYLDVIRTVKAEIAQPVAAYQVSGEYAMIKAAAANGWIDERSAMAESLISIKRSGADCIASYFAPDAVQIFGL